MTDVLLLRKITGVPAGETRPLDDRMRKHVRAGNAIVLPNAHESWESDEAPAENPPAIGMVGTGTRDDDLAVELGDPADAFEDEDTEDSEED